jgi:hypothetical protein
LDAQETLRPEPNQQEEQETVGEDPVVLEGAEEFRRADEDRRTEDGT